MTRATLELIAIVERLNQTGLIGDGTVERLHELAHIARLELDAPLPAAENRALRIAQAEDRLRARRNAPDADSPGGRQRITLAELQLMVERGTAQIVPYDPNDKGGGIFTFNAPGRQGQPTARYAQGGLRPSCFGSEPNGQAFAENGCDSCVWAHHCLDI